MNSKKILTILCLLTLVGCNPEANSSSESQSNSSTISNVDKTVTVEDIVAKMNSNFSVNYKTAKGTFNVYRTEDYFYDEELEGGQFILYDDTMYVYTIHNDVLVPRVPFSGYRKNFEKQYPSFKLDMDKFSKEGDVYYTTDANNLTQLGLLINSTAYDKASLFIENGLLNFRFYNSNNKIEVTGKVFGIDSTSVPLLDTYLENRIDPETEIAPNNELIIAANSLNDNFTFIGQNNTTNAGLSLLINENYVASFTGTKEDYEDLYGYIALEDGLHSFTIENDVVDVDFEVIENKDFIKENYSFKRHDFTKFKKISDNTYISSDAYNVNSFCDLLTLNSDSVNLVKLTINENETLGIDLMYNHYSVYSGTIFNIENSMIDGLEDYVNGNLVPDLEHFDNTLLVEATKDLKMNFTYVNEHIESEDELFYGVYSSEDGRKEYKEEHNNFPSTDYIVYEDFAYSYVLDEYKVLPQYYNYLDRDEYKKYFSFESIDFTHFKPIGTNKWMTNSRKYMNILSKLLGSNPYDNYHHQAIVELVDGALYFEILDTSFGTNTKGYLKDINTTSIDIINEYKTLNDEPTRPSYTNTDLINVIDPLRKKTNFTVKYHDDPEYNLFFDEKSYDYWTEDVVYFGDFEAGFITSSKSNYIYEYAMITDEETNTDYLTISSLPSLYLNTVSDFNSFRKLTDEQINSFMPYNETKYISYDDEIIQIFVDVMQLGGVSFIGYSAVILEIVNNELVISIVDVIDVTYDENGKRYENLEIFATATITNVGTTKIPSFAIVPSIK